MNETTINSAYNNLSYAKKVFATVAENLIDAKNQLEVQKAGALLSGAIEGKNAELREASARDVLGGHYLEVAELEAEEREARLELDLASIEVERVKSLIRLEELLAGK